jgi:hypothetical protein
VVGGNLAPDALDASRVEPRQRDRETVPELLLELTHHALGRDHQDAARLAAAQQLCCEDASLQRLAQAHGGGDEQARPKLPQYLMRRHQLELQRIHHRLVAQNDGVVLQSRLPQPRFDVQARGNEGGRVVEHQLGLRRVDERDVLELRQKQRTAIAHSLRDADAAQLPATELANVGALDGPLLVTDQGSRAGRGGLLQRRASLGSLSVLSSAKGIWRCC